MREQHIIQYKNLIIDDLPYSKDQLLTPEEVWDLSQPDISRARSNPHHLNISNNDLRSLIYTALQEVDAIEVAARNLGKWNITSEMAKKTELIIYQKKTIVIKENLGQS